MAFNTAAFIIFITVVLVLYYLLPARARTVFVLLASYAFFARAQWRVLPFLVLFSLMVYLFGRLLGRWPRKWLLLPAVLCAAAPLIFLKYTKPGMSLVLPLGLSYFTFKSIGYLADVMKGKAPAEKNPLTVMTFVAFFPEMLIGPIDRADNLMVQLKMPRPAFDWQLIEKGALLFLGGCVRKMIIADRLGIWVDAVYADPLTYAGPFTVLAAVAYALQIYFDFSGCTHMALGVGRMMGFDLPENFRQPYLAVSVADFWRRWHMSLTSWLKTYIYIPLGGSRRGRVRRDLNILIVFLVSGIWHGAGLTFVVWGLLNGVFQLVGRSLNGLRQKLYGCLRLKTDGVLVRNWQRLWTFIWMTIAWVFFRASSVTHAGQIFSSMRHGWRQRDFLTRLPELGLSWANIALLLVMLLVMLVVSLLNERQIYLADRVMTRAFPVRVLVFYLLIFGVLIFGIYGTAYDAAGFIYLQF